MPNGATLIKASFSTVFICIISFVHEMFVLLAVLHALERTTQGREGPPWFLSEQIPTNMHGSGQQHKAWIFSRLRKPDHP